MTKDVSTTLAEVIIRSQVICGTSVDTTRTPVVDVIGQLIRDVIGRLSVES